MRSLLFGFCCFFGLAQSLFAQNIHFDPWQKFSDQSLMPSNVILQKSNNNDDIILFKGRYYVGFRTAPSHFASKKTRMYVVSSVDFKTWDFEYCLNTQSDLREPRFVEYHDSLYFYCFKGGTKWYSFEPEKLFVMSTAGNKKWTEPSGMGMDGFVPWRLKVRNDTILFSTYYGKDLYNDKHKSDLRLYFSTNGREFKPLSIEPQVSVKTAEEGEFDFDRAGTLFGVVRLEGYGALIVRAEKDSIDKWHCVKTKYKYDEPLLFEHKDEIYLVSRRNLDGPCDRAKEGKKSRRMHNLIRYSFTKKCTTLFKLNKNDLTLSHIMDFPSTGDCSFPAIQKVNETDYILMNYSSDITKRKKNWINGQTGKTYLYWTVLHMN